MDWFKNLRVSAEGTLKTISAPIQTFGHYWTGNSENQTELPTSDSEEDSEDELDEVWLDDNVVEHVKTLCEMGVFRDYPKEALEELKEGVNSEENSRSSTPVNQSTTPTPGSTSGSSSINIVEKPPPLMGTSPGRGSFLGMGLIPLGSSPSTLRTEFSGFKTKRQQRHAEMMLEQVPELAHERFQLVPDKFTEEEFWLIYFNLIKRKVGKVLERKQKSYRLRDEKKYKKSRLIHRELYLANLGQREEFWQGFLNNQFDRATAKQNLVDRIPDKLRTQVWCVLLGVNESTSSEIYYPLLEEFHDDNGEFRVNPIIFHSLVHRSFNFKSHCLNRAGQEAAKRIIWLSKRDYSEIFNNTPFLADLVCLLLTFLSEDKCYVAVRNFLNDPKFQLFISFNQELCTPAFLILLKKRLPVLASHIDRLNVDLKIFIDAWFSRLFVSVLPYQTVLNILDLYLFDGYEVPFRVAISLFRLYEEDLLKCTDSDDFLFCLQKNCDEADINFIQVLFEAVSGVQLENDLMAAFKEARLVNFPNFKDISAIVNEYQFAQLWSWLPQRIAIKEPILAYRASIDGFNLHIVAQKCQNLEESILLLKTKTQCIFGALITIPWEKSTTYRGTGEMFLFSLAPEEKHYVWTKDNDYFMILGEKSVAFGGGKGTGLWLDDELDKGSSEKCETFNNEPLSNGEKDFECTQLEIFSFI